MPSAPDYVGMLKQRDLDSPSTAEILDLHTYFVFPFSIDQNAVMEDHPQIWSEEDQWFEKLDVWITTHVIAEYKDVAAKLGGWTRLVETKFDMGSNAYQDMVFFHPFIRRAFFDAVGANGNHEGAWTKE